jgi:hypothetical protein
MRPGGLLPLEHSECKNAWQALNRPCLHGILPKELPRGETISLGGNGGFGVPEAVQRGRPLHFWSRCSARMRRAGLRRTSPNCRRWCIGLETLDAFIIARSGFVRQRAKNWLTHSCDVFANHSRHEIKTTAGFVFARLGAFDIKR